MTDPPGGTGWGRPEAWEQAPRPSRAGRRRRLPPGLGAAALLLLVIAGGLLTRASVGPGTTERSQAGQSEDTNPGTLQVDPERDPPADPTATSQAATTGSWATVPPAPLAARAGASAVWTGREVLVWGGVSNLGVRGGLDGLPPSARLHDDGAAYDPATGTWRALPASPLSPRTDQFAVWTGEEMLVWGGLRPGDPPELADGAAYHPGTDSWRRLAVSPVRGANGISVPLVARPVVAWTGRELLVWPGRETEPSGRFPPVSGAAYDLAGDTWRVLPPDPNLESSLDEPRSVGAWSGAELFVWSGYRGMALDPRHDRWRRLPPMDEPTNGRPSAAVWTGREVFVAGVYPRVQPPAYGLRFDPRVQSWSTVPLLDAPPAGVARYPSRALDTGGGTVAVFAEREGRLGPGARWTPSAERWERLPAGPVIERAGAAVVWTGTELVVWGGADAGGDQRDGFAWRPAGRRTSPRG